MPNRRQQFTKENESKIRQKRMPFRDPSNERAPLMPVRTNAPLKPFPASQPQPETPIISAPLHLNPFSRPPTAANIPVKLQNGEPESQTKTSNRLHGLAAPSLDQTWHPLRPLTCRLLPGQTPRAGRIRLSGIAGSGTAANAVPETNGMVLITDS